MFDVLELLLKRLFVGLNEGVHPDLAMLPIWRFSKPDVIVVVERSGEVSESDSDSWS
jgi:hypothetical protein